MGWVGSMKMDPWTTLELSHLRILRRLGAELCPVDAVPLMWDSTVGEERSEASDFFIINHGFFY